MPGKNSMEDFDDDLTTMVGGEGPEDDDDEDEDEEDEDDDE